MTSCFRSGITAVLVAGSLLASACGGDDGSGGSSTKRTSIAGYLDRLPESVRDGNGFTIVYGDLDRAADLADTPRPDGDDAEEFVDWLIPLTGVSREGVTDQVFVPLPNALNPAGLRRVDEFEDELGWSALDVHSFIEYQVPPNVFSVMSGDFDEDQITDAIGDAEDGIWYLGEEDFGIDVESVSAARRLGESLRLALKDGQLAVARSADPVEEWLKGDAETFGDDEDLIAVAKALDAADAYSAMLVVSDGAPTLGIGLSLDDGRAIATFVYAMSDEGEADDGVDAFRKLIEEGSSTVSRQQWRDAFSIEKVEAKGNLVIASVRLEDFRPGAVFQIVYTRDNLSILE